MTLTDRAVFIAAYSRLVADVWAEPAKERQLEENPRSLLEEYDLTVPATVAISVVRDPGMAPDIEVQVQSWADAARTGSLTLFVPPTGAVEEMPLDEDELDSIVAGLDTTCACCCPCCCT